MNRDEVEAAIRSAFAGVRLGSGVSLRQAAAIDVYLKGMTEAEFEALPLSEVTDDWTLVPEDELRSAVVPHLDADGLRYYLPALLLWLLKYAEDEDDDPLDGDPEMTRIGIIGALAPRMQVQVHTYAIFDGFSAEQRAALASYVEALPRLVGLYDEEDATLVARSLDQYWRRFLPDSR